MISGSYNKIFYPLFPNDLVQTFMEMENFQEESHNILSQNEVNSTKKHSSLLQFSGNYLP